MTEKKCKCEDTQHKNHPGNTCAAPATTEDGKYCQKCNELACRVAIDAQAIGETYPHAAFAKYRRSQHMAALISSVEQVRYNHGLFEGVPGVVIQFVITGDGTKDGRVIEAVSLPWFEIIDRIIKEPAEAFQAFTQTVGGNRCWGVQESRL